jgi:chromosome segregation ATPase
VAIDNTFTASHTLNPHLQEISRTLDMDQVIKSPPHTSDLNNLMTDYSNECIYVPPHLPSRILNEPISDTKEDITKLLQAVDKNIRRINIAIPNMSIDSAAIDKECDLMEVEFQNMMKAVREAYKKDLEFRKELARLEVERLEKEKKEAEERERKRLEDERIEKERKEAEEREQARLAEEARIAAEQARLADFARNAPEFAILMREDQENLKRTVSDHSTMLAKIFSTLQSIDARLPPPPQP